MSDGKLATMTESKGCPFGHFSLLKPEIAHLTSITIDSLKRIEDRIASG